MKAILAMDPSALPFVFGPAELEQLQVLVDIDITRVIRQIQDLSDAECCEINVLITGWGAPTLDARAFGRMPALRAIVHWGGGFGFIDQDALPVDVRLWSARAENAIPVAEFTLAMITLAAKDALWVSRRYAAEQRRVDREAELPDTGLFGKRIGIVGASTIGHLVIEDLVRRGLTVVVYDPFLSANTADDLGVTLVDDLRSLAAGVDILSVHAPESPKTYRMISRDVLSSLQDGSTLINTARGALIDQDALVEELVTGRIRAILDVTDPEVLPEGHPLYTLPNVMLTPHLAGSTGTELRRLGQATIAQLAHLAHTLSPPAQPERFHS